MVRKVKTENLVEVQIFVALMIPKKVKMLSWVPLTLHSQLMGSYNSWDS